MRFLSSQRVPLSPNYTSFHQPMDNGIIATLIRNY